MNEVVPKTEDTAQPVQPPDAPPVEIEVVDTPVAPEVAAPVAPAAPQPLIAGKFRTVEEAEKAYSEAQRAMHEKAQEAATYRKMLEERAATPPQPAYQAPAADMGEKFREQLADDPFGTLSSLIDFRARQMLDRQQAQQRELVQKYQSFSSRPEYADVAQEVAAELPFATQPIDPIEGLFLRKKLARLEAAAAGGQPAVQVTPPFVEPGVGSRRTGANTLRVELDPDTAKLRGLGQDRVRDLARIVAKRTAAGGSMREMSIDDWEKTNA